MTGRRQSELDAAVKQIGENNIRSVQGDVSNMADLNRLYAVVEEQKGRIDILFANAGVSEFAPLGTITEPHFDKIIHYHTLMSKGFYSPCKSTPTVS